MCLSLSAFSGEVFSLLRLEWYMQTGHGGSVPPKDVINDLTVTEELC